MWRTKNLVREGPFSRYISIKVRAGEAVLRIRHFAGSRCVDCCDPRVLFGWQTNPEIQLKQFGENFSPVLSQSRSSNSSNEFVQQKTKRAGVIAVRSSRQPIWFLFLERFNDCGVIEYIYLSI